VAKGAYRLEEAKPLAPAVRRDSFGDGVEGVMDGLAEAIKVIPDALRHPLDSAYQMFEASKDQYEKAVKAAGPGRDNKGDVAGFIQHAVGMFPVLGPMASNLLDAVDSGSDSYEVGKRAGNLLSLKVVPEITKKGIALAGKAAAPKPPPSGPRPPPPSSPVNVGKLMSTAKSGAVNVGVRVLEKAFGLPPGSGKIVKNIVEAVREEMAGKTTEVAPPTPTVVEAPPVASGTPVRPPLRGKQFGTFNDPTVPPLPAGVTPAGPVLPPLVEAAPPVAPGVPLRPPLRGRQFGTTVAKMMREEVPGRQFGTSSQSRLVPAEVPPAAVETPQPATPAPSAAGNPVTAATLMEEVAKPAGKKVPPFDWTDEAQFQEYQKALVEDSNIYGNNRTTMADRVTRFMKKNGIEPTDSGIVRALNESAEDIAVSPTTGLKRPSFNAADHEVLFDMIKDRLETPTGGKPAASAAAKPAADSAPDGSVRYVRFGKPPESGFSVNRRDGTAEAGISTHRLIKHNGEWHLDHAGGGYTTRMDTRPTYELAGELVGYGSDGEPLLKNVTSVKPYKGTPLADLPGTDRTTILEGTPRMPMSAISQDVTTGKVKFLQDPHYADGALTDWMTPDDLIDGIQKHWHTKRGQGGAVRAGELISKIRQAVEKIKK
jgi:hypothetical protein